MLLRARAASPASRSTSATSTSRQAAGHGEPDDTHTRPHIEHPLALLCPQRRRQQDRVQASAIALLRLQDAQRPAEERIVGHGIRSRQPEAPLTREPPVVDEPVAQAGLARARRRAAAQSGASTSNRRGKAPIDPSTTLMC